MKEIQKLWRYKMGHVPSINFKIREGNEWIETNSHEMFKDKKVIIFSLPGAFTPTCSTQQLPGYEDMFEQFQEKGKLYVKFDIQQEIDDSVNLVIDIDEGNLSLNEGFNHPSQFLFPLDFVGCQCGKGVGD